MPYHVLSPDNFSELNELNIHSLGIVPTDDTIALNPHAKTLVIGLGGMGQPTVHNLKKSLENRIGKIPDTHAEIRFLVIDTAEPDLSLLRSDGVLSVKETFYLYNEKLGNEITKSLQDSTRMLVPPAIETVLPAPHIGFNPMLEGGGSGQIRLAGKISLMEADKFDALYHRIKDAIFDFGEIDTHHLEIHIIAGIGGGTGSGLIIDIPYLMRKIITDLAIPSDRLRLFGHIYLPNVYNNGEVSNLKNAYRNGYAALKEIDYYMNIEQIGETYNTVFPLFGEFVSRSSIFDRCTLIGGKLSTSIIVENTKKAAIDCCVNALIGQVMHLQTNSEYSPCTLSDFLLSPTIQNGAAGVIETLIKRGSASLQFTPESNYKYTCLGAASLHFPQKAIIECFIGEVYAKMLDQMKYNAVGITQKEVDKFADGLISPDDLLKETLGRFDANIDNMFQEVRWNRESVRSTNELEKALNVQIAKILDEFDKNDRLISKAIASASNKASDIFKDTARGPLYLAKLLTGGERIVGYYEMLDSYTAKMADRMNHAQAVLDTLYQTKNELMWSMTLFNFKSKLPKFLEAFKDMYVKKLEIALCERLARDYYFPCERRIGACYSMKKSLDNNYLCFVDIITRIGEILVENAKVGKSELSASSSDASNILALNIDSCLDPLKNSVAHKLETRKNSLDDQTIAAFASAYFNAILTNREQWSMTDPGARTYGPSKCAVAFRSFIKSYELFGDILSESFATHLDEAYQNATQLEKAMVVQTLSKHLCDQSEPMFNIWQDCSWADLRELSFQHMVIPDNLGDHWKCEFETLVHFNGFTSNLFESADPNTLSHYTMYEALPLWLHEDIVKYERAYCMDNTVGLHINESPGFQPPYREYPPLFPKAQWGYATEGNIHYSNDRELTIEKEIHKLVDFCLENHIILSKSADGYYYARTIANKPNIYSDKFKQFIRKYCEDENSVVSGGIKLYESMLKEFGETEETITPLGPNGNLRPEKVENLYVLIRHQMQLLQKLRLERAYLTAQNGAFSLIDEYNMGAVRRKQ